MKSLSFFVFGCMVAGITAHAQMISDPNLLNNGITAAPAASTSNYPSFSPGNADDLSANQFYFGDYQRTNTNGDTNVATQDLTFSSLVTPTGINSLRFYNQQQYEDGRVATQVTIYYSAAGLASGDFTLSDYTPLNSGTAYSLPIDSSFNYVTGTGSGDTYDDLTNLNIPVNTTNILLDFGPQHDEFGGSLYTGTDTSSDYNVGAGFREIQAFGGVAVPEPSTWALFASALTLCVMAGSKLVPSRS